MRISTFDPISMHDVTDTDHAPFVVEVRADPLKVYFENEANKAAYLAIQVYNADAALSPAR